MKNLDLTSKVDPVFESIEFRTIIAEIKLEAKKALRQELFEEVHEKTEKSLNETILNDNNDSMENLIMESTLVKKLNSELADKNIIFKQLNQELTDTNDLLKEKLNTRSKDKKANNTYAEIVSNAKPKTKLVPKIVVRKTNKEETMKNN